MNLQEIFTTAAQKFIEENTGLPIEEILLKAKRYPAFNVPLLASQIEGKAKAKVKLPSFYTSTKVVYPVKLSMEQCSSEQTAQYKASLVSGDSLIDLTGGFGVDSLAFSDAVNKVTYIERNAALAEIVAFNCNVFSKSTIEVIAEEAEVYLTNFKSTVDWIYLDPARRKEGGKVVRLEDCEPNILAIKDLLFSKTNSILLKTSPLLDIDLAVKELGNVKEVHVISIDNECKELLFVLEKNAVIFSPRIVAINFLKNGSVQNFNFSRNEEQACELKCGESKRYLYEPNSSVMKAGAFKSIAQSFKLTKLHPNSHLYTADFLIDNFPGRAFEIVISAKYSKKVLQELIPEGKANISVRNFPDTVEAVKKKTGIKDGGAIYLFCTTDLNNKLTTLVTSKIN